MSTKKFVACWLTLCAGILIGSLISWSLGLVDGGAFPVFALGLLYTTNAIGVVYYWERFA